MLFSMRDTSNLFAQIFFFKKSHQSYHQINKSDAIELIIYRKWLQFEQQFVIYCFNF